MRQSHAILLLDVNVFIVRDNAQHRNTADVLEHFTALVKQAHIATELVDDDALDKVSVLRLLQGDAAIDRGKYPTPIDVANQDYIGMGMMSHGQVYQVGVAQVDFRNAACTLHDDGIIAGSQTIESIAHFTAIVDVRRASAPIVIGILIADGLAV